jgi:hypothetical protein
LDGFIVTCTAAPLPTFTVSVPVELAVLRVRDAGGRERVRLRQVIDRDGVGARGGSACRRRGKNCRISGLRREALKLRGTRQVLHHRLERRERALQRAHAGQLRLKLRLLRVEQRHGALLDLHQLGNDGIDVESGTYAGGCQCW